MDSTNTRNFRRTVLRVVGYCGAAALGLPHLAAAQTLGATGRDGRRNAWNIAQQDVGEASSKAARITETLDTLTSVAARAATTKVRTEGESQRLSVEVADLTGARDRLLDEYRNGLFCSGCNQTKSQILAKRETFPHPGQTIIKPTPAQIDTKERELQDPIDQAQRALVTAKKDFKEAGDTEGLAFAQIRAGVALWRTAVTYWRGSVNKATREREAELQTAVLEFQTALDAELRRQSRRDAKATDAELQAEADVWRRLLDKQKNEIDTFKTQSQSASIGAFERVKSQRSLIDGYLHKPPLAKTLLAVAVVDAPVSPGLSAGELGVNYHMGQLAALQRADSATPPPLPAIATFVAAFKSAGLGEIQNTPAVFASPPPALGNPAGASPATLPGKPSLRNALP